MEVTNVLGMSFINEEDVLNHFGLNPKLVLSLSSLDEIPIYNDEEDNRTQWTDDFYIDVDSENGNIHIHINGYDSYSSEDDSIIEEIKTMCDDVQSGCSLEDAWYNFTHRLECGY